jgi:O-antigen ligase
MFHAPVAALLVFLPWLNPFAPGPSPSTAPWLASAASGIVLAMVAAMRGGRPARGFMLLLALGAAWAALVTGLRPEVAMLAGGLALVAIASAVPGDEGPCSLARALQCAWLAAAALSAVIALLQYLGFASALQPWFNAAQLGEAYGNLRQPNLFASLCSLGIAVLLWGALRLPLALAFPLVMLLAAGSAASVSRTGAVQGLLLALLAAWWGGPARRRRLALCAAGAASYLLVSWGLPLLVEAMTGTLPTRTLWGRVSGSAVAACSSRTVLWHNVLHLIADRPLAGWGWGELDRAHFLTLYPGQRFCDILDNAHNLPLHLAVELGVPFAVLVCGLGVAWAWRQRPWAEQAPLRQLAWAVIAVILLHSLLEYPLWYGPFQIAFGVAVGWLLPRPQAVPAVRFSRRMSAVLALMFSAVAYAAWDYARVSQIYLPPEERMAPWREDTLQHVRQSWLFSGQAGFADLTLTELTSANVHRLHPLAERVLHYSPEPRVIERLIESETMLGRTDEAVLDLARYRAAFPRDYAAWRAAIRRPQPGPTP